MLTSAGHVVDLEVGSVTSVGRFMHRGIQQIAFLSSPPHNSPLRARPYNKTCALDIVGPSLVGEPRKISLRHSDQANRPSQILRVQFSISPLPRA